MKAHLAHVEEIFRCNAALSDEQKAVFLKDSISEELAGLHAIQHRVVGTVTYQEVKANLSRAFDNERSLAHDSLLGQTSQLPGETISMYVSIISNLILQFQQGNQPTAEQVAYIEHQGFIALVYRCSEYYRKAYEKESLRWERENCIPEGTELENAYKFMIDTGRSRMELKRKHEPCKLGSNCHYFSAGNCMYFHRTSSAKRTKFDNQKAKPLSCTYCGAKGHVVDKCWTKNPSLAPQKKGFDRHPDAGRHPFNGPNKGHSTYPHVLHLNPKLVPKPIVTLTFSELGTIPCLLDTGADINCISKELVIKKTVNC